MVQSSGEVKPRWRELARVVVVVGATAVAVVAGVGPASSGLQPRLLEAARSASTLAPADEVPLPTVTSFARNVAGLTHAHGEAAVDAGRDPQAGACVPCVPGPGSSHAIAAGAGRRRTASSGPQPAPRATPPAATAPTPPAPAAAPTSPSPAPTAPPSRVETRPAPPVAAPGQKDERVETGNPPAGGDGPGRSEDKAEPAAEQQARRDAARSSR